MRREHQVTIGIPGGQRPERLDDPYFAKAEPEELLYDQIEALWAPIDAADDWTAFHAKLAAIERARLAWGFDC